MISCFCCSRWLSSSENRCFPPVLAFVLPSERAATQPRACVLHPARPPPPCSLGQHLSASWYLSSPGRVPASCPEAPHQVPGTGNPRTRSRRCWCFSAVVWQGRGAGFWVMKCSKQSFSSISMPSAPSSTQPHRFHSLLMLCESSFPPKAHQDSQSQTQHQRLLYNLVFSFPTPPLPRSPHYTLHPIRSPLPFAVL